MLPASLSDAPRSSVLVEAAQWLQHTVLGTVATSVAVTAVAWMGLLMLLGRLEIRRGLTVVLGCFILFGATSIVGGIQSVVSMGSPAEFVAVPPQMPVPPPPRPRSLDPYAGASLATP